MREEQLKELLEKYFSGESSLAEEKILRKYFDGDMILPGYEAEKEMFRHFSGAREIPEPSENLELKIAQAIDSYDKRQKKPLSKTLYFAISGIAAILIITFGFYFFLLHKAGPRDTFSDPAIAYAETMKVLNDISVKLNRGTSSLKSIGKLESAARLSVESIDHSATILTNSLKPIENIGRLSDTTGKLNK